MSKVTKINNTTNKDLEICLTGGGSIRLPAGSEISGVDVENINELKKKVQVTEDLTEVNESGKQRLLFD